jgi:hypothetical protein
VEKMISFPEKRVRDLTGLYFCLKKSGYAVRNVGADQFGTYIYMDDVEEKDPAGLVEEWMGKAAPSVSDQKAFEARKVEAKKAEEAAASARAAEEAARVAASPAPEMVSADEPEAPVEPQKESLMKRIFKILW